MTVSVTSSLHTLSNASSASVHLPQGHPMPIRRVSQQLFSGWALYLLATVAGKRQLGEHESHAIPVTFGDIDVIFVSKVYSDTLFQWWKVYREFRKHMLASGQILCKSQTNLERYALL